jgi:hypothetical protein
MANRDIFIVGGVPQVHDDSLENRRMANGKWRMGIFSFLVVRRRLMLAPLEIRRLGDYSV